MSGISEVACIPPLLQGKLSRGNLLHTGMHEHVALETRALEEGLAALGPGAREELTPLRQLWFQREYVTIRQGRQLWFRREYVTIRILHSGGAAKASKGCRDFQNGVQESKSR